eukprot:7996798-Karenia_brevis.AAC.1
MATRLWCFCPTGSPARENCPSRPRITRSGMLLTAVNIYNLPSTSAVACAAGSSCDPFAKCPVTPAKVVTPGSGRKMEACSGHAAVAV